MSNDLVGDRLRLRPHTGGGIKVQAATDVGGANESITNLLIDLNNPTGYAQVFEEKTSGGAGTGTLNRSYVLGDDVLTQAGSAGSGAVRHLLYDGHGSTRLLTDNAPTPAVTANYNFDAYGNALGFDPASATTRLLYAGEYLASAAGQYYLRARHYDTASGRFNRVDPFAGNNEDPQSLHKYAYAHSNPVMGIDPSGRSLVEVMNSVFIGAGIGAITFGAAFAVLGGNPVYGMIIGGMAGSAFVAAYYTKNLKNVLVSAFSSMIVTLIANYVIDRVDGDDKSLTTQEYIMDGMDALAWGAFGKQFLEPFSDLNGAGRFPNIRQGVWSSAIDNLLQGAALFASAFGDYFTQILLVGFGYRDEQRANQSIKQSWNKFLAQIYVTIPSIIADAAFERWIGTLHLPPHIKRKIVGALADGLLQAGANKLKGTGVGAFLNQANEVFDFAEENTTR